MGIKNSREMLIGVVCSLLVLGLSYTAPMLGLDRIAYDWGIRLAHRDISDKITVVAIDDDSIASLGRWPWSREVHAALIDVLSDSQAKVIAHTVFFLEPQIEESVRVVDGLLSVIEEQQLFELASQVDDAKLKGRLESGLAGLTDQLLRVRTTLDSDARLSASMKDAGSVILPMWFTIGKPLGNPDQQLPQALQSSSFASTKGAMDSNEQSNLVLSAIEAHPPYEPFLQAAARVGHLVTETGIDGATRQESLVVNYYGSSMPSVAVQAVVELLNLTSDDIQLIPGKSLKLGGLQVATDQASRMRTFFYMDQYGRMPFEVVSFVDVVSGRVPPRKFKDKIVLVGSTAVGIGDVQVTPVDAATPPVIVLAHTISTLLEEDFIVIPEWATPGQLALIILVLLYLVLWVPGVRAAIGGLTSLLLLIVLVVVQLSLIPSFSIWVPLMPAIGLLVFGYLSVSTYRFLVTEKGKKVSDSDSAESNRMLGLSFQGQGQLDIAFDKFRKCPLDASMMELLYNLGLDFERKRQFSKASSVYGHMAKFDSDFKDIEERIERSNAMDQSVILSPQSTVGQSLVHDQSGIEKPMLGRYEVLKELGKGAMGIVYLGQDPKISRTVAIKTLALAQEFEEDELVGVKARFFREAETAGRLNHPNIVTIFDVGDEHDLAYIAMEFLQGTELTRYTKPEHLLPIKTVLTLMAEAADALAYAAEHNVVHRDVKPANMLYDPDTGKIKLTDFGIARITDSSKTKTGTVLGTPSYMSPEQISGKKADGRADLFSLGVMIFQLLTGKLPFSGDSMASLMFAITSSTHVDPKELRKELPSCVSGILDVALSKDVEDRYQNGYELAADLRHCAELMEVDERR